MQQPGWIFRELCHVKKSNHHRLCTIRFPLHNTLEVKKLEISDCQGLVGDSREENGLPMGMEMFCILTVEVDIKPIHVIKLDRTKYTVHTNQYN